jgi:adenylate cyclase
VTSTETANASQIVAGAVAFSDICGFTEFTALRGDDAALRLLAVQDRLVRRRLPHGARIVKELGDGLLLWFPDAESAVTTTLDLQDGFQMESAASELPLWVRIGVHWGNQRRRGDDLIGHDVNVASRVADVAGPAEVVVTEALLAQLCEPESQFGVTVERLGPVVMKGLPEAVRLFRLTRSQPSLGSGPSVDALLA